MANVPNPGKLRWLGLLALVALGSPAAAQTRLSLSELEVRNPAADYLPARLNQLVVVRGVVNSKAYRFSEYSLLAIEDGQSGGVLKVSGKDPRLNNYLPGDEVEAEGTVAGLAGMPVVLVSRVEKVGQKPAPVPLDVPVDRLIGFSLLGRLVRTEVEVRDIGDTTNGEYLVIAAADLFRVFLPRLPGETADFRAVRRGGTVSVTGVAYQYCLRPPYNRYFQILVAEPSAISPADHSWFPPPAVLGPGIALVVVIGCLLWYREHRLRVQRERLRKTYHLGEQILGAASSTAILERVNATLPGILGVTRARLYIHNRAAKTLEMVATETEQASSAPLAGASRGPHAAAVACFHYQTVLGVPDVSKSPFAFQERPGASPKSLLLVPMMAQTDAIGVLELDQEDRLREFTDTEQELAQHVANQIAVSVRLLDQRIVQEQLFRTEKLAAVGRLISGVVNELQAPLASISNLANRAYEKAYSAANERELSAIAAEARKASGMVARLVSYAAAEQGEARPVPISNLLRGLIEFREGDFKASGIRVRDLTTREPLFVLGSQGQLEQVFLNLLVHAEQSLADSAQKSITIRTSVMAKRVLVEIAFTAAPLSRNPEETAAVLGVTRSVIAGHGGEVRLIEKNNADPRFEVDLPLTAKDRMSPAVVAAAGNGRTADPSRRMTALVIEPDETVQRQILALLSARGYRVVPVDNADKGLDLAQRMRFDAAFCSVHAPGLNWVELSERMQSRVGGFILLSDRYDAELSADFEGDDRFVLAKPIQEPDLERILQDLDPPVQVAKNIVA